jgi:hypothetical protein
MARVRTEELARQIMPARRGFLAVLVAAVAALVLVQTTGGVTAQAITQIQLTEKQVLSFVAAQKDMAAITDKMQGNTSDKPDPKIQAELEAAAKKYGFANFAEYDDVAANISLIMGGIDAKTKKFTEPREATLKEIEEVKNDKSIPAKEKKQMLDELNEALKSAEPIKFRDNIALVTKHFDKLEAVLQ